VLDCSTLVVFIAVVRSTHVLLKEEVRGVGQHASRGCRHLLLGGVNGKTCNVCVCSNTMYGGWSLHNDAIADI
jgi:hypothetical protein